MNLKEYQKWYVHDEGHWYVSKVKQYHARAIQDYAHILNVLSRFFSLNSDAELVGKYRAFRPKGFFDDDDNQIRINDSSKLFISLLFIQEEVLNQSHLEAVNPEKFKLFSVMQSEFLEGRDYEYFINKYTLAYLTKELIVYYRNFKSWLGKFGFYGEYEQPYKLCYITDIGYEFAKNYKDLEACCAIFNYQVKKLQFWNPTIDEKYNGYRIRPYYILLEVILKLPDNYFTKNEYALFINKIKSHDSKEIQEKIKLIKAYRELDPEDQHNYINEIIHIDKKLFKRRKRTKFEELIDSAPKEIGAYSFGEHIVPGEGMHRGKYILVDAGKAQKELNLFTTCNFFIEFKEKLDWIAYLGSMKEISIEEIVELYIRNGKSHSEIQEQLKGVGIEETIADKLYENEIEEYYVRNIKEIDPNLEVVKEPAYGRQFRTHIGPIDILCKNKITGEYVVIELKRGQTPDDTVGQILRYMGWVYINLAKPKDHVNGILLGSGFSDKIDYSLIGTQNDNIFRLISRFEHPFTTENKPTRTPTN